MTTQPGQVVADFVAAFAHRDTQQLAPFLHPDVEFEAYGDVPVHGRDARGLRVRDGLITEWRDQSKPQIAQTIL